MKSIDKTSWPDGPWKEEEDFLAWKDGETGFHCEVARMSPRGYLCGYVKFPLEHLENFLKINLYEIDVHGGVTFSAVNSPKDFITLGFDCAHLGDLIPNGDEDLKIKGIYRTLSFVMQETKNLAGKTFFLLKEEGKRLKSLPAILEELDKLPPDKDHFVIFSFEHQSFWKKNRYGYSLNPEEIGLFSYEETKDILSRGNIFFPEGEVNELAFKLNPFERKKAFVQLP